MTAPRSLEERSRAELVEMVRRMRDGASDVRSHLDRHLGDTDPPGAPETDWKDGWPIHWAAWRLSALLDETPDE